MRMLRERLAGSEFSEEGKDPGIPDAPGNKEDVSEASRSFRFLMGRN